MVIQCQRNTRVLSLVGRSERSDLRHGNLNVLEHVRAERSDLRHGNLNVLEHVRARVATSDIAEDIVL